MKIVYTYCQFTRSAGTERIIIDKMNYFAEKCGYEVYAVTNQQGNHPFVFPLSPKVKRIDLDVRFCDIYRCNRFVRLFKWFSLERLYSKKFDALMSDLAPDIVISLTYHSYIFKAIANCKLSFCKLLESHIDRRYIHDKDPINRQNPFKWIHAIYDMTHLNHCSRKFDLVVALNNSDAKEWSRYLKAMVIPDVVHLNPTGHLCDKESKRIIFVGRLTEQKGIHDLLKIWELIYKKHSDWSLDIYGDGELHEEIVDEAKRLDMNICVHEPCDHIFECYCKSALLVLTSKYEPFGLVMPEAMSCGLPVVAFDCPSGPAAIITDGQDGYLIKNRDIVQFAEKVCYLIESPNIRIKMGENGVASSRRFSAEQVMPQWESLFRQLVVSKNPKYTDRIKE